MTDLTNFNQYELGAYFAGRKDMQQEIIDRLGDYEANKCAQIAASVPVDPKDAG